MNQKENYSNFGFFQAMLPFLTSTARDGEIIDLQGYCTAVILVNGGSCDSGLLNSAGDCYRYTLMHASTSAAGTADTWSLVPTSQIIHSVYGGIDSTASTGLFGFGFASTMGASGTGIIKAVGYKMDTKHRWLKFYLSISGNPSTCFIGAEAILGQPGNWPINLPAVNG
jgi:hypothetical protein